MESAFGIKLARLRLGRICALPSVAEKKAITVKAAIAKNRRDLF